MVSLEVSAEREVCEGTRVSVENGTDFAHVCEAVVVLRSEGEFTETFEGGDTDRVEVPPTTMWREKEVFEIGLKGRKVRT